MKELFGNPMPEKADDTISFRQWQIREGNVLYRSGVRLMGNTHLLAHLIRNHNTAEQLMRCFGDLDGIAEASVKELKQVKGIGLATAETIQVAFELSRRLTPARNDRKPSVFSPNDVYELLRDEFYGQKQEVLKVLLCDTKNQIQRIETVFIGTLNCSLIHPREIFKPAIRHSAASIIITHNHPSGTPEPSKEDIRATKQIAEAGELVQIPLLDHLVIGDEEYVSMKEEGLL